MSSLIPDPFIESSGNRSQRTTPCEHDTRGSSEKIHRLQNILNTLTQNMSKQSKPLPLQKRPAKQLPGEISPLKEEKASSGSSNKPLPLQKRPAKQLPGEISPLKEEISTEENPLQRTPSSASSNSTEAAPLTEIQGEGQGPLTVFCSLNAARRQEQQDAMKNLYGENLSKVLDLFDNSFIASFGEEDLQLSKTQSPEEQQEADFIIDCFAIHAEHGNRVSDLFDSSKRAVENQASEKDKTVKQAAFEESAANREADAFNSMTSGAKSVKDDLFFRVVTTAFAFLSKYFG